MHHWFHKSNFPIESSWAQNPYIERKQQSKFQGIITSLVNQAVKIKLDAIKSNWRISDDCVLMRIS